MNIGIVTTWFERGASYVSRQYMDVLQKTDEVFIYARGGEKYAKGNPKWDLPNVHWAPRGWANWKLYGSTYIDKQDFRCWIDDNKIDILFFNEQRWIPVLLWCKDWKIKTAAYVDYYTEKMIPYYDLYDCLICNTKRHAFAFRNNPGTRYLKWGTDIDLYKPNEEQHDKLTFFNSAGMDSVRKGTDLVIQAFYKMKNRQKSKLLIHTQHPLSNKIAYVQHLIDELLTEGSLEIVEQTVTAPGLYYKADVYVYPSRLDGIGLTLMEAAASGLACITINNAPMNEFVEEDFGRVCEVEYYYSRSDGYYWPMGVADIDSLSNIMESFAEGKVDVNEMKKKARQYAEKELDFSKNMCALHGIFEHTEYRYDDDAYQRTLASVNTRSDRLKRLVKPFWSIYMLLNKSARPF